MTVVSIAADVATCPKCGRAMNYRGRGQSARSIAPTKATFWSCPRCEESVRVKLMREKAALVNFLR